METKDPACRRSPGKDAGGLVVVSVVFCCALLVSNLLAIKPLSLPGAPWVMMDAGNLLFPVSYICGDLLVEVWGLKAAQRAIWLGFGASLAASLSFGAAAALPGAAEWGLDAEYAAVLGQAPRVATASLLAFLCGEHLNAWMMARMKRRDGERRFWWRAMASTFVGEGADSAIFTLAAFAGVWGWGLLAKVACWNYVLKVAYEALLLPVTGWLARHLGRPEGTEAAG